MRTLLPIAADGVDHQAVHAGRPRSALQAIVTRGGMAARMLATSISTATDATAVAGATSFHTASAASAPASAVVALFLAAAHATYSTASIGAADPEPRLYQCDDRPGMQFAFEAQRKRHGNTWGLGRSGLEHRCSRCASRRGRGRLPEV